MLEKLETLIEKLIVLVDVATDRLRTTPAVDTTPALEPGPKKSVRRKKAPDAPAIPQTPAEGATTDDPFGIGSEGPTPAAAPAAAPVEKSIDALRADAVTLVKQMQKTFPAVVERNGERRGEGYFMARDIVRESGAEKFDTATRDQLMFIIARAKDAVNGTR